MKLEIRNYTKKIKNEMVLLDVNQVFEKGKVYLICGRNGSGKTMLLRALSGLIRPTSGEIIYNNEKLKVGNFLEDTRLIIGDTKLLKEYTGFENLKILNSIHNKDNDEDLKKYLKYVGLDPEDKRKVSKYSLGMNQKLVLAQLFIGNPHIWLIDEPTNSLDKESAKEFNDLIKKIKKDKIIIIASHLIEDFSCVDVVLKMDQGVLSEE